MGNILGRISAKNIAADADIATVLGESSHKLSVLCTSSKINMWSLRKPVHIAYTNFPDRNSEWWRGTNNNCGIEVPIVGYYDQIKNYYDGNLNGWWYDRPRGGAASPYRQGDFALYFHKAVAPVGSWSVSSKVTQGSNIIATVMMAMTREDGASMSGSGDLAFNLGDSVTMGDIWVGGKPLSQWKLGIVVYDKNGERKGRVISDSLSCNFNTQHLTQGQTYTVYPFLALNGPVGQMDTDIVNSYTTLVNCSAKTFKVETVAEYYGLDIEVKGWRLSDGTIRYRVAISIGSGSFKVNSGYIHLRFTSSAQGSALLVGEYYTSIPAWTVTPTNPLIIDERWLEADISRSYRMDVMLNTQAGIENYHVALFAENPNNPIT